MMTQNQKLVTKEQASFTELIEHQESVLLDLESLHYYSLNSSATLLWKYLRSGNANTFEELNLELAKAYGVSPEMTAAETAQFIQKLRQDRLLVVTEEAVTKRSGFIFATAGQLSNYEAPAVKTSDTVMEMNLASGSSTASTGALGGGS
jgi:Coenzyme PQQ synthesis protein D (PqqD)